MGLDMYLSAKKYVSGHSFSPEKEKETFQKLITDFGVKPSDDSPSAEVSINIGYWRKSNAIHGWFVRECASGIDDCRPVYVPRLKLEELRSLCVQALANKPALVAATEERTVSIEMSGGNPDEVMAAIMDNMTLEAHNHEFNDEDDTDPLRPVSGFFFGGTEKDEWYYQDLADTVAIIDEALALGQEWDFEYQASW